MKPKFQVIIVATYTPNLDDYDDATTYDEALSMDREAVEASYIQPLLDAAYSEDGVKAFIHMIA